MTRSTVPLRDGRTLSYLDLGDPAGTPLLFCIGSPSSAVGGIAFAGAAERAGVRLISIDKPGYGESTRDGQRSLLRFGEDVRDLADALGLDTVALAGQSGGGPHMLAAAYVLGDRVSTLSLLSTAGPVDQPWSEAALENPLMRVTSRLANKAPWLMWLPMSVIKATMGTPQRARRLMALQAKKMTPRDIADHTGPESQYVFEGAADAFSGGLGPVCDEFRALGVFWGFHVEDVTAPVDLWHGTRDKSCPIAMVRAMAQGLPDATLHELDGVGHGFFGAELDEAMATVRMRAEAARRPV